MRIVAIDPGKTTGVVEYVRYNNEKQSTFINPFEVSYPNLIALLYSCQFATAIVIEDFIVRRTAIGTKPEALKVIGAIETNYVLDHVLKFQQPSQKQQVPDNKLKDWCTKHDCIYPSSPHIKDAFRHLIIYLETL